MIHDIDDLLEIIRQLEERIIKLELLLVRCESTRLVALPDDHWYWEHG